MEQKYFVRVELVNYHDEVVSSNDFDCGADISSPTIIAAAAQAAYTLVTDNLIVKTEQDLALNRLSLRLADMPNAEN